MNRWLTLALLVVVVASGCGRAHLFYDARELRHNRFQERQKAALAQTVAGKVGARPLVVEDARGEKTISSPGAYKALPISVLGALFLVTSVNDRGGENDIRVHVGQKQIPVSVYTDLDGALRVETRDQPPPPAGPAPEFDEIRARYALTRPQPKGWSPPERRALDASLAALAPEELAMVRDLIFIRKKTSPDGNKSRAALFEAKGCVGRVTLFSSGIGSDRFRFIGTVDAPKSATLHSIVHELGHALEATDARERYCAARGLPVAKANPLISEGNRLLNDSPVVRAYAEVLGKDPAPTDYGNSSLRESFAESFALFHVDPRALERARPQVYAWFAAGGHLKARQPLQP